MLNVANLLKLFVIGIIKMTALYAALVVCPVPLGAQEGNYVFSGIIPDGLKQGFYVGHFGS